MNNLRAAASDRVLEYMNNLPDWSRRICLRLRTIILSADPSIVEDWKWGPHYASNGMVCGVGAFQKHVKFTFFNGSGMKDPKGLFNHCVDNEFSRSIKFTDESEIDEDAIRTYVQEAAALNKSGFKRQITDKTVPVPADLEQALSANSQAQAFFNSLSYGYRKEFVEHVLTAKQDHTRVARINQVVGYCGEGKRLNDKYKK